MNKLEYYNRTCKAPGCDEVMEDLSWRAFCNEHLEEVLSARTQPEKE